MKLNLTMTIEDFIKCLRISEPVEMILGEKTPVIEDSSRFVFRKFYDEKGIYAIGDIRCRDKKTTIQDVIVIRKDAILALGPIWVVEKMRNQTFYFHGVSRDKKTRRGCFSGHFVATVAKEISDILTLKMLEKRGWTKEDCLEKIKDQTPRRRLGTEKEIKKLTLIGNRIATQEVNYAIKDLLKVVDPECWEVARKFSRDCKYSAYVLSALEGERFMQLAQSSPVTVKHMSGSPNFDKLIQYVRDGKKLSHIMDEIGLPYCMRKLPAKFVRTYEHTYQVFGFCPQLFTSMMQFMPKNKNMQISYIRTSHEFVQRLWFGCITPLMDLHETEKQAAFDNCTELQLGVKMHHWIMRNYEAMDQYEKSLNDFRRINGHSTQIRQNFSHIEDYFWDQFRYGQEVNRYRRGEEERLQLFEGQVDNGLPEGIQINRGQPFNFAPMEFHVDRFDKQVALHTIQDRVREWDDRRDAEHAMRAGRTPRYEKAVDLVFPEPWIESQTIEKRKTIWEFIPVSNYEELVEEGKKQHHCVSAYASRIAQDRCYIYSLRKNGKRDATIELNKRDGKLMLAQFRTACNGKPENASFKIVNQWLANNNKPKEEAQ